MGFVDNEPPVGSADMNPQSAVPTIEPQVGSIGPVANPSTAIAEMRGEFGGDSFPPRTAGGTGAAMS
jgi:hypothetical protein